METYFAFCVSDDVVRMLVLIIAKNSVLIKQTCSTRVRTWTSPDLYLLDLYLKTAGLGLGLRKICNQVHFQFSLCTFVDADFANPYIVHTTKDLRY